MNKKRKLQLIALCTGFMAMTLGVLFASGKGLGSFIKGFASRSTPNYSLTLDSSNKVTSEGDKVQHTALGNDVTFTYSGVSNSTSGHVTLNSNGYLVNKTEILSISSFSAVFDNASSVKFKLSYDGATWGSETVMESGYTYNVDSNPYFIRLSATSTVTINSLTISYLCYINPDAAGYEVNDPAETYYEKVTSTPTFKGDEYLIVSESTTSANVFNGNLDDLKSTGNYLSNVSVSNNRISATTEINNATFTIDASGHIRSHSGYYVGHNGDSNDLKYSTSVQYTNDVTIESNGELTICCSGGAYLRYNSSASVFRYYKSSTYTDQRAIQLYKKVVKAGGTHIEYNTPEDEIIGFGATDTKANNYLHDDIYDNTTTLSVWAKKMGGETTILSKGGENGYSYVIKNSAHQTIDTSKAFVTEGTYILIISYKNFIPVEITLNVGFRLVVTGIEAFSENSIFNTAQKLSDFTSGITANMTYNRESNNEEGIPYSSFDSKGLSLTLINPSQVNYSITTAFGTAGTWTIKVTSTSNPSIYGTVQITVNAIPVTSISVTGEVATVEEESQLQLTAAVTPNNATNPSVTWSSNHTNIATVNTNGLVTGVSAGEARITATANDGSTVFGYIDITVTAKPVQTEYDAAMAAGTNAKACTVNGSEGVKVATGKAEGDMTIMIGAGATRLSFYAAGWNAVATTIALEGEGVSFGTSSFTLTSDSGVAGNGTDFTLSGNESIYYHETTLIGVTEDTEITVSSGKRFVLWKAKYYTAQVDPVYPTSISLEVGSSNVAIEGTTSIEVSYLPADTNIKNVTFSSNHTNIATVSDKGVITGVAAGSARITATAEAANNGTVSSYVDITVTAVAVTGVSVNPASASLSVGGTQQLTATISPSNATNQSVTWSSDATSVATVSSTGLVTAKAAGTATITVESAADNTKKATATITVTASGGGSTQANSQTYTFSSKSWAASPANWSSGKDGNQYQSGQGIQVTTGASGANGTSPISFDAVQSVVVSYCTNKSSGEGNIKVSIGSTQIASQSVSKSGGTSLRDMTFTSDGSKSGKIKIEVECTTNSIYVAGCTINYGSSEPTNPTSISLSPSSLELSPGGSKDLAVNYTPSNANQNKEVTWSRYTGSSNISVSSAGKVTVSSNATAGNTAVIRATLTNISSIYAQCTVTVVEQKQDDQTILIYICGSDLESNGQTSASSASGYATGDITEMLSVSGQPDDVNVVLETGGAKCWKTTHGINKNYTERYHLENQSLVRDSQLSKANMGSSNTLRDFITWGVQTYPADRISLILWNHGGAMRGVCYDENNGSDSLTNSEVKQAVSSAFTSLGRSTSDKFEWIGYDACLMQVQDIAEFNSQYFNYMVASEESEAGDGWDYDTWLDDAYSNKSTETILTAIADGFIAATNLQYQQNNWGPSDQTLSWLNLSYMSAYKTAWENMATSISSILSSYGKSNFQNLMKSCKYFGSDDDCEGYSYFGIFDAKDVLTKLKNNNSFSSASTQINTALTEFGKLVRYSKKGSGAGNAYGLCCFFPMKDGSGYTCNTSTVYKDSQTNFSNWKSIVDSYGD